MGEHGGIGSDMDDGWADPAAGDTDSSRADENDDDATDSTPETRNRSESAYDALSVNVHEERERRVMFLPEEQDKRRKLAYNRISGEYYLKYDKEPKLNQHFYPVLIQLALDALEDMDAEDFQEQLERVNELY